MKYQAIRRCRNEYPIQLMCRCLKVSTSGFHAWCGRTPSPRTLDNRRLLSRIRDLHAASDGVMGMPRMHEQLGYEGQTASPNRIARIMAGDGLYGVPQRRRWLKKPSAARPTHVRNHLERDFAAAEPNTKWVTDISVPQQAAWEMRVWPLAIGLQEQVANHRKRLGSKAPVVSVAEKAPEGVR